MISATIHATKLVISRYTCSYIRVKNHSVATSVHLLSIANLKRRISTHSGEKQFLCDQCNYSCNRACNLKIHMRQHFGEKPFVCKQCNFTCKHLSSLRTHIFSHTGKELYACKKCNYSCKQSGHLKRHMEKFHTT